MGINVSITELIQRVEIVNKSSKQIHTHTHTHKYHIKDC